MVGHWISATGDLVTAQLGMERFHGPHTGANPAEIIWKLLEEDELRHKVGYFTTDNTTNNDTAMYESAKLFSKGSVAFDLVFALMRCFVHVINLVVKLFLWGQNADEVVQELGALDDDVNTTQKLQLWRKRGPIGHLHHICTWISHTSQQCDRFTEKAKQMVPNATACIPLIGNITRMHGDVDAIERAFILRTPLDEFLFTAIQENQRKKQSKSQNTSADDMLDPELIVTDKLSEDDWEDLKFIHDILSLFKVWSLQLQGLSS